MNRLLFVSNLFPDQDSPLRGLDNAVLLRTLREHFAIRVIVPRPSLRPSTVKGLRCCSEDHEFDPVYVPVPYLPKAGSPVNAKWMRRSLRSAFRKTVQSFSPQAVLTSWLFPDGCAMADLCREENIPSVLITQGTDTHTYLSSRSRKQQIIAAIDRSAAVICRSSDLGHRLHGAGAAKEKLHTVYNGVDAGTFRPESKTEARNALDLSADGHVLLFVGNFLPVKNPLLLIQAHAALLRQTGEPVTLALIGHGPLEADMRRETDRLGTQDTVTFTGPLPSTQVARWMNAADLLCMTSHNEGLPNVILEALASRLRVLSTDVGGISEVIDRSERGLLVAPDDLPAYTNALSSLLDRSTACAHSGVEQDFSWESSAQRYRSIIESAYAADSAEMDA